MTNIETLPENLPIKGIYETRQVFIDGKELFPGYSIQVRNHSPDGFNWGYGGSGPAQLALGILLVFMSPGEAQTFYQQFKWNLVANLPRADFEITLNLKAEILKIENGVII